MSKRIQREENTVSLMIAMYCKAHHQSEKILCDSCSKLDQYAKARTAKCRFGVDKPACSKCTVHCYNSIMREQIREVMRFAGPRMLFNHPFIAIMHIADKFK